MKRCAVCDKTELSTTVISSESWFMVRGEIRCGDCQTIIDDSLIEFDEDYEFDDDRFELEKTPIIKNKIEDFDEDL